MNKVITILSSVILLFIFSCKKESFITSKDARLNLSVDSLKYDTVFTTTGSVTQFFKIKNDNNQKLHLDRVTLKGGTASFFKINVDGFVGPDVKDIDIEANDSIYVFVSVSINQNGDKIPFIIRDSIQVVYNGNDRFVQLEAWGQNAHFLRNRKLTGYTTWKNDLPYVILGGLQIDTTAVLTIEKGCRIYLHADAPLIVDGTLEVLGERFDSTRVYFQGDRLDVPYSDYPAAWPGIFFRGASKNSIIQYAVIRNAYQGIIAEQGSVNGAPKVQLDQCIIDNIYDVGIYAIQSDLQVRNCLISNCGKNVVLGYGGKYEFTNCTVVAVSNNYIVHKDPSLLVTNNIKQNNVILTADLYAVFTNCIFWGENGSAEDEVVVSKQGTNPYLVQFSNCLWKVKNNPSNVTASNIIANQNPAFDSINVEKKIYNFRLKASSPAINKGISTGLTIDLDGNPRNIGLPDMGSYEHQ